MAAEEDKKFDAVLGGFLVHDLRVPAGNLHCPEADLLAAYHERTLRPEEMNSWKKHIAGCARCQAVLAELEATDSMALRVSENEAAPAAARPAAARTPEEGGRPAMVPEKPRVTSIPRRGRWQWLVPAGALAAGLLMWVGWHENRPQPGVETAKMEPSPRVPEAARQGQIPASSSLDETLKSSKEQATMGGSRSAGTPSEAKRLKQLETKDSRGPVVPSEPQKDKETGARADAAALVDRVQDQAPRDGKATAARVASEAAEVPKPTANTEAQTEQAQQNLQAQQNQLHGEKAAGPSPFLQAQSARKAKSEARSGMTPAPAPAPPAPGISGLPDGRALGIVAAASPQLIFAPSGKTAWRAGPAGRIEFSADGGASWSPQASNVGADLRAGSAPSDKVCWIVGRGGTILLTTDAGAHWAILRSPLEEDLGGVRSTDALHATIWNLSNTKAFVTADGGVSWKPPASP